MSKVRMCCVLDGFKGVLKESYVLDGSEILWRLHSADIQEEKP